MAFLVLVSAVLIWAESEQSAERSAVARHSTTGAVALADAQSALWQLRWGLVQFMVTDEAGRRQILADEPKSYAQIGKALDAYAASHPSEEEKKVLKAVQEHYAKYIGARPKWFELYGAGKLEEAAAWRAATTTAFGAATVKAFAELIELQQKASRKAMRRDSRN
ncbi:hypothetical protein HK414_18520 [Ramlibacter terrae]|uniref:Chemotaxis methyl-accepting receptor HlyB-like 4HB MCP domain-containing protein n=1 Tax=Ramlibacter terrae TaxID=2732511 RepID=A0ABX6P699_9BURK|nr:hypothetical protein HK414_18520 [Ramlibacter terrae]